MSETESMSQPVPTRDSYENFIARMGVNESNQSGAGTYRNNWTSRNRLLIEQAYRTSWLVGAGVDAIPDDMTRKGVTITSKLEDGRKEQLDHAWDEMGLWEAINDTLKWARLYGGAVGVILIDGQNYSTPLRVEAIAKDSFKGVMVMDRWMLNAMTERRVSELGPDFGMPEFYKVVTSATGIPPWRIHHSRLIRFDGIPLPYQQRLTENDWGMSVIERCFDRLLAFDSTTTGVAQLVYKAHLRTYSIEGLRKLLAMGKDSPMFKGLMSHMDMIREYQSNEGMTIMDAADKFEAHTYSYAGLSDVLAQFGQQVSGAFGIPLVRLFGQSPAGFSTGDTDLADRMRQAMRDTKGIGNFRNLFMYAPNGKPDGIKILPLSEVATKDDFFNIKKASRDDLLSAHRVPPQMMGIIPDNSGGFGDAVKAAQVFVRNKLTPLQERLKEINNWLGEEVIAFRPYSLEAATN